MVFMFVMHMRSGSELCEKEQRRKDHLGAIRLSAL